MWATNSPSIVPITTGFTHTNPVSTAPGQVNQIPTVEVEFPPPVSNCSPAKNQVTPVINPNPVGDIYHTTSLTVSHPEASRPADLIETDCSNDSTAARVEFPPPASAPEAEPDSTAVEVEYPPPAESSHTESKTVSQPQTKHKTVSKSKTHKPFRDLKHYWLT